MQKPVIHRAVNRRSTQGGMMLIEVLISILVFSFGVLGMVLMQGISSANSVNSEDRATAARLANDIIAELWTQYNPAAPGPISAPPDLGTWQSNIATVLRNGTGTLTIGANNTASVVIKWNAQGRVDTNFAYYTTQVVIQ